MAELADALDSGSNDRKVVEVQVLLSAPDPWPAIRNELPAIFIVWLDRERISCLSPQYILSREADCCKTIDFFYFYYLELR